MAYKNQTSCDLVFQHLHHYYSHKIITFTNTAQKIIIQMHILIKHKMPMAIYSLPPISVPLNKETIYETVKVIQLYHYDMNI